MNRLTKVVSMHNNEPEFYEANIDLYPKMMEYEYQQAEMDCINKLGQLEDIEEELGINLITLFKALKNGFYHIDENKHIYTTKPTKGNGGAMNFYVCLECIIAEDTFGDQYIYSLKDYGKVWALTKEELEQNE